MKITDEEMILFIHGICQGSPIIQDQSVESKRVLEAANLAFNKITMLGIAEFDIPEPGYEKMIAALELSDRTIRTKNLYKNQIGDGPKINVRREYKKRFRTAILMMIQDLKDTVQTLKNQQKWN